MEEGEAHDADQHEGRAEHREDEELEGGVDPLGVPPPTDEEVHRHQHDLEHDEEHEQVEGAEDADAPALEHQQPGVVRLRVVVGGDGDDGQREQQPGQDDEEQRDAVDPQVPRDAEVGDPGAVHLELEAAARLEGGHQPEGDGAGADREEQSHETVQLDAPLRDERDRDRPEEGHHDGGGERGGGHRMPRLGGQQRADHQMPARVRK